MQAPLLAAPQTAQKNLTDVANKVATDPGKTSFQTTLDKQVRAKQNAVQTNHAQTTQMQNKKGQHTPIPAKKDLAGNQAVQSELNESPVEKLSSNKPVLELESKGALTASQLSVDINDKAEIIPVDSDSDSNVIALMEPIQVLPTHEAELASLETSAEATPTKKNLNLLLDGALATGKNADIAGKAVTDQPVKFGPVLDGVLATAKNTGLVAKDVIDTHAQVNQVLDHTRWLSGVAGKAMNEDVSVGKTMLNAVKDVIAKELTTAPTIQPQVAQIQSQLAAQQITQPLGSTNMIGVYPGKAGWDQAISQKVMWMVGAGEQSAQLTLNPPDLGPLKVVIHVHNNQADTTFISDNDEVRQALESGLSHLRDKMNESGVQLGQTNVSSSSQSQQDFQQAAQNRVLAQAQSNNGESELVENVVSSRTVARTINGLVDTFA